MLERIVEGTLLGVLAGLLVLVSTHDVSLTFTAAVIVAMVTR